MSNLNADYSVARKLAEAIYDFVDLYGIIEVDEVVDVLTGDTNIEDFIKQVEDDLKKPE